MILSLVLLLGAEPVSMDQLSPVRPEVGAPQLVRPDRSTTAPPALSRQGEGRPSPSRPLGGADRCDPQAPPNPACARILEQRAGEFARPAAAQASPEERLLRARGVVPATDARTAARAGRSGEGELAPGLEAAAATAAEREALAEARAKAEALQREIETLIPQRRP